MDADEPYLQDMRDLVHDLVEVVEGARRTPAIEWLRASSSTSVLDRSAASWQIVAGAGDRLEWRRTPASIAAHVLLALAPEQRSREAWLRRVFADSPFLAAWSMSTHVPETSFLDLVVAHWAQGVGSPPTGLPLDDGPQAMETWWPTDHVWQWWWSPGGSWLVTQGHERRFHARVCDVARLGLFLPRPVMSHVDQ